MGETFTCEKTGKIGDDRFRWLIAHDQGIRSTIDRSRLKWEGRNLLARQVPDINHRNPVVKREKGCKTRTSEEVTQPSTILAQARLIASSDGIRCISAGMIAPAMLLHRVPLCGMIEVQLLVCWIEGNRRKTRFDICIVMRVSGDVRPDRTVCPS